MESIDCNFEVIKNHCNDFEKKYINNIEFSHKYGYFFPNPSKLNFIPPLGVVEKNKWYLLLYDFEGDSDELLFGGLELHNNIQKMHLDCFFCGGFCYTVLQMNYDETDEKMYINLYETNPPEEDEQKYKKNLKEYFFHKEKMTEILSLLTL